MNKTYTRIYPQKFTEIPAPKKGGKEKKQREKGENPAMIFNIVEKQRTKHLSHLKHIYRRAQYSYFNTVNII